MELDFSKDYYLENDSVRLEPLTQFHSNFLTEIAQDKTIWRYFFEKPWDLKSMTIYVNNAIHNRKVFKEYPFVIYDKTTNLYAGCTRFYNYSNELKIIRLGHTWLGKDFQGKGINKNAKYLLFQFVFETLKLERIGLGAYADNKQSIAAMKNVGCQQEGIFRNMFPSINGTGRSDAILMSILKDEWFNKVKNKLKYKLK